MSIFKWRHFEMDIILWAVHWYCSYGISYRELEEMMLEKGIKVDHSTIYRWVVKYYPEIQKKLKWNYQYNLSGSWRVDETYVKVKGKWKYLYRIVDKHGKTIDFYLSASRSNKAAYTLLSKALNGLPKCKRPHSITTDKHVSYGVVIVKLKKEGRLNKDVLHRHNKYLNNII